MEALALANIVLFVTVVAGFAAIAYVKPKRGF